MRRCYLAFKQFAKYVDNGNNEKAAEFAVDFHMCTMREMQEGTVSDVKDTRKMLHDVQKQTLELIDLQKGDF